GGIEQELFQQFVYESFHLRLLLGRKIRDALHAFANKSGAFLLQFATQQFDNPDQLNAGLPRKKFVHVLVHDSFGTWHFTLSRVAILLHDLGEVVDVVKVEVIEIGSRRFNIARKAEIHHEERTISASRHGSL